VFYRVGGLIVLSTFGRVSILRATGILSLPEIVTRKVGALAGQKHLGTEGTALLWFPITLVDGFFNAKGGQFLVRAASNPEYDGSISRTYRVRRR
jgi:hypothetical protein